VREIVDVEKGKGPIQQRIISGKYGWVTSAKRQSWKRRWTEDEHTEYKRREEGAENPRRFRLR
jgi:hypothetical protein